MKLKLLLLAIIPIFIISSCVPEKTIDPKGPNGFGYSTKPLSGTPWALPSGVNLQFGVMTSPAVSSNLYIPSHIDGTLDFYMIFRNNNPHPATILFPVGLMFPSPDTFTQNSLIVQPDSIVIPADTTYYFTISTYCINDHRTFEYGQVYGTPIVSDNANLTPLLQVLALKQNVTGHNIDVVQQAIWDIADSGKLSTIDIAYINQLP